MIVLLLNRVDHVCPGVWSLLCMFTIQILFIAVKIASTVTARPGDGKETAKRHSSTDTASERDDDCATVLRIVSLRSAT